MNDVTKWIVAYLVKNCGADEVEVESNLDANYFQAGYIDSFRFINMISEIEEKFGIELDSDRFEDKSFSTVNGLSKIIEEIKGHA